MTVTNIPDSHPRAHSLRVREAMKQAVEDGLVHGTGLIAHGRGEAFDYLLGEASPPESESAIQAAAVMLLGAKQPVLSLNGNVVALAGHQVQGLRDAFPGLGLEINLFHRTPERIRGLLGAMQAHGVTRVLGAEPDDRIPGLESDRALCCKAGIGGADVVLVPLEDGDRCLALKAMGKRVITIDLNPLSRTAKAADITIVDELTRALPALAKALATRAASGLDSQAAGSALSFDNVEHLRAIRERMAQTLLAGAT